MRGDLLHIDCTNVAVVIVVAASNYLCRCRRLQLQRPPPIRFLIGMRASHRPRCLGLLVTEIPWQAAASFLTCMPSLFSFLPSFFSPPPTASDMIHPFHSNLVPVTSSPNHDAIWQPPTGYVQKDPIEVSHGGLPDGIMVWQPPNNLPSSGTCCTDRVRDLLAGTVKTDCTYLAALTVRTY
jgi:hypothetical protein